MFDVEIVSASMDNHSLGAFYSRKCFVRGVTSIFVHSSLKFTTLKLNNYCHDKDIEVCAIRLKSIFNRLCIISVYRSPLGNFADF